jgi:hypothetical protein
MTTAGFFDGYPSFFTSSPVGSSRNRLNRRYDALIARHVEYVRGKRVLDLASHGGRWSLAALAAGAAHVTGIDARPKWLDAAALAMIESGFRADRYEFLGGDVHDLLPTLAPQRFDTVFCLGFLYHTVQHIALLSGIARLRPSNIIIDTDVDPDSRPVVYLAEEDATDVANATAAGGFALVGIPSRGAVELMLRHVGYGDIRFVDWLALGVTDWKGLGAYRDGRRVSPWAGRSW